MVIVIDTSLRDDWLCKIHFKAGQEALAFIYMKSKSEIKGIWLKFFSKDQFVDGWRWLYNDITSK